MRTIGTAAEELLSSQNQPMIWRVTTGAENERCKDTQMTMRE